jgi:hypothetical protein
MKGHSKKGAMPKGAKGASMASNPKGLIKVEKTDPKRHGTKVR